METETAVRSIVCIDTEVTREMLEKALDLLRGKTPEEDVIVHNIRFADAMEILMVSRRTLRHYLDSGYLDRVYGGGRRAIGVTRESLVRFMSRRTVTHKSAEGITTRRGIACEVPGRHWGREMAKLPQPHLAPYSGHLKPKSLRLILHIGSPSSQKTMPSMLWAAR